MRVVLLSKAYVLATYRRKAAEIAKLGVELTLVAPPYWRDERGVLRLEPGPAEGYRQVVLPIALNGSYHLHWNRGLGRLLREVQPDILHVEEEPYNLATFLAFLAAGRVHARVIFFTWQNLARPYPLPFRLIERYCYSHAAFAIGGSQGAVEVLRRKGYDGPAVALPQFGVDPEQFPLRAREPDGFTVGYVGRLVREKGVDLLLRSLAELGGSWRLSVLGSGPEQARLQALACQLGLAGQVEFRPPIPSEQLPAHLAGLNCLVLPSISLPNWREQFGRVLVEAMATGVPVLGSTCGEIPNVIGTAGLLFPEGDISALASQLQRLRDDASLRARLARAGRERVLAQFTHAAIARSTVDVYRRALASGSGRSFTAQ